MAKILVISNYRSIHTSRPEAEIFIGLEGKGIEVHIMTFPDAEYIERFQDAGIQVVPFHPEQKFSRSEISRIRKYLVDRQIDILFLFNSKAIINGIQAARKMDVKIVLYRGFSGHIHWYDPTAYFKYLHPKVDKIICNSTGVMHHIRKALLFNKSKAITINKGHNLEWYSDIQPIDRKELPISEHDFAAVCVANDRKMKGVRYLLRSTYHWPKESNIHLLLVGKGMDKQKYLKIIENSPNRDRVHILGFRKDALRIVAASDVFILSSIYGESITKSVLESMSLGVPAIITDIPGNQELVEHGKSGWVVPAKDPLALAKATIKLSESDTLLKKMATRAQERIANRLSNKRSIDQYYALIQELLEE